MAILQQPRDIGNNPDPEWWKRREIAAVLGFIGRDKRAVNLSFSWSLRIVALRHGQWPF